MEVAKLRLEAAQDEADAILARGKADADVIRFENEAEAAGWRRAVEAFQGDGQLYAQYVLYNKLASSYRKIMANTADSPIMQVFEAFAARPPASASPSRPPAAASTAAASDR